MSNAFSILQDKHTFSEGTLNYLSEVLREKEFHKGYQFLYEGDVAQHLYFLVEGFVKIFHTSPEGREQILTIIRPGNYFNTVSLVEEEGSNRANASALSKAKVLEMARSDFEHAMRTYPDFSMTILKDFSKKLTHLTKLVEELSLFSIRERLIRFLMVQASENQEVQGWTQAEIAAQIGTVRDVVGRLLGVLVREGLIRVERQRILLIDEDRLKSLWMSH